MNRIHWLLMLMGIVAALSLGCDEGDDDDDDDDSTADDDDSAGDDDTGDDDDSYDPEDVDGDGVKTTDDPPDCDDNDPTVYPGAWEIWDYKDNDCDNDRDEQMPLHRQGMVDGQSYDGMSIGLLAPGDITGDGLADVLIGTESRGVLLLEGSETRYDYDGVDSTTLGGWDNPDSSASQDDPNGFGTVMTAGDPDNDGDIEIFIAGHLMDGAATGSGNVYLFDPSDGDLFDVDATFAGDMENQNLGVAMSAGFDINTDGIDDVIIAGRDEPDTWQLFVFYGGNSSMTGTYAPADADAVIEGPMDEIDDLMALGAAPDLNGDGSPELLIGLPMYGDDDEGQAYLMMSRVQWDGLGFESAEVEFQASTGLAGEHLGYAVGNAGNVVGQESEDIYISANGYDGPGAGYGRVLLFGADEHSWMGSLTADQAEAHLYASRANDFGTAVVPLGSIELDEFDDIAVLATDFELDGAGYGALFIIRGRQGGFPADHEQGDGSCHYVAEENDYMGPRVVAAGDMDGDGYSDLVLGDYLSGWGDGRVYVLYTPESPLAR